MHRAGRVIDRSAKPGPHYVPAIGVEEILFQAYLRGPQDIVTGKIILGSVTVTIGAFYLNVVYVRGLLADDVYYAALCTGTPQIGTAALYDLDSINAGEWERVPIDPSAKSIGFRNPVEQNQSSAGASGA